MAVILDIDMPRNCFGCKFIYDYSPNSYTCTLKGATRKYIGNVPPWCPLHDLVKCKECKYYDTKNCENGHGWCMGNDNATPSNRTVNDEWFCKDGVRKK